MLTFPAPPPLALYCHLPWCVRKCPYCDFNSHRQPQPLPEAAYLGALLADLDQELGLVWGRPLVSIFLGGGTPSLFSADFFERLLSSLRARFAPAPELEITLEANPGTVEWQRFADYRAAGINRLSLGVQSLSDPQLQALGRIHTAREGLAALAAARRAGFTNLNVDLMFGLPGQSAAQARADLAAVLAFAPEHLSYYELTVEPHTAFAAAPPPLPDSDDLDTRQRAGQAQLAEAGLPPYEVSAHARPGYACRHNLNYWQFGDYLGIGAGAHGKWSDAPQGAVWRRWKVKGPSAYMAAAEGPGRIAGSQRLEPKALGFEFMLNALRLHQGFASDLFPARTGLPLSTVEAPLRRAEALGLIRWGATHIAPTPLGRAHLNNLLELFLP